MSEVPAIIKKYFPNGAPESWKKLFPNGPPGPEYFEGAKPGEMPPKLKALFPNGEIPEDLKVFKGEIPEDFKQFLIETQKEILAKANKN
ncbi:hypothetical protein BCR36DRAFT_582559 [Piromyces finnis]|uniref:Uncharacterized protein n=1 Tax=Piromyces finnis TaxID=1754191 RepID=A0A1Y1VCC5_9FUNG|nr:hypothetical protein BCR36DRAFT_582559 [Piromyces finnis]|eukprot:ORX52622.1 hypothetical protein BCR36DRAFT_582559 [Piromyces finnis]